MDSQVIKLGYINIVRRECLDASTSTHHPLLRTKYQHIRIIQIISSIIDIILAATRTVLYHNICSYYDKPTSYRITSFTSSYRCVGFILSNLLLRLTYTS